MTSKFVPVRTDIERDHWGRPMILQTDGVTRIAYRRTTTFTGSLDDKTSIGDWKARMTAAGMADDEGLQYQARGLDTDTDKKELGRIAELAQRKAGGMVARERGSAIHLFTERLDAGQEPGKVYTGDIEWGNKHDPGQGELVADSADYQGHLETYMAATKDIEWIASEIFRVHDKMKIAGTADRIGRGKDGIVRVYDLKTGSLYGGRSMAMQLGMYARMTPYNILTDERAPLEEGLDQNTAVIIHMPVAGKEAWYKDGAPRCDMYELNIAKGFGACQVAEQVFSWRGDGGKGLLYKLGEAPRVSTWEKASARTPAPTWASIVDAADTLDDLRKVWKTAFEGGWLTEDVRALCTARGEVLAAKQKDRENA